MLDTLRQSVKGTWAKIIFGLIIITFVFAGVGSYLVGGTTNPIAKVNGEEISRQDYELRYQQERNRFGEQFSKYFNTEEMLKRFQGMVIERLIVEQLATQANEDLGIFVGQGVIKEQIKNTPEFQINGNFDADTFRSLLSRNGWTPSKYETMLRQDMQTKQLSALMDSEFALDSEVDSQLILQGQTRTGAYLNIDSSLLQPSINFQGKEGDKQLEDYYQSIISRFVLAEKVTVEYIELKSDNLETVVTQEDLEKYYNEHLSDFGTEEERQASHILIITDPEADEKTLAVALASINALAERIDQGEDFATIAKENSDDSVSATNGGDLGFFGRNVMDKEFEKSAFGLKNIGEVSDIVKSEFGFHIIKLTAIKPPQQKTLEEVKTVIEASVKIALQTEQFVEINNIITEKAFEFTDSLEEVAATSGLTVQLSEAFPATGGRGIFANPAITEAAFSNQVMVDGYNSDVISLGDNHAVVLRLKQHIDSRTQTFEEVKIQVENILRKEQAIEKAINLGEQIVQTVQQGESKEEALKLLPDHLKGNWLAIQESGRNDAVVPQQIRTHLFKMAHPAESFSVTEGIETSGGYAVIQLQKINQSDASKSTQQQKKQVQLQLAKEWSSAEDRAFQDWLQSHADIERFVLAENAVN